jgi:predicted dienelactone hydrolase
MIRFPLRAIAVVAGLYSIAFCGRSPAKDYDPLAATDEKPNTLELVVADAKGKRELPILVYLPKQRKPAPVVLFSHGLGGSRHGNAYLGKHWSGRGYVAVFLQHPGSDDSVWKGQPLAERMAALRKAADAENFLLRTQDVKAVLDALEQWNNDARHALANRLDLDRFGMSGHSFGAVTTQAVSGQSFPLGKSYTDSRIKAAVLMSPSPPRAGGNAEKAFAAVRMPWLLLTGTHDGSPIGNIEAQDRLLVFPALPNGDKYELVLNDAEHSAFSDTRLPGDKLRRNPNHHNVVLALTTAFWDAYLRDDVDAKAWLQGPQVKSLLESGDRWQTK